MTDLPRISFVLGGARSGKSGFAQRRAEASGRMPVYIATAQAFDAEMTDRIARHQADRDARWRTVEAPFELPAAIRREAAIARVLVVDCLTLWLSNLMLGESDIDSASNNLVDALSSAAGPVILVSNEVGLGIVPDNALARAFRDAAGQLNQAVARIADEVMFIAAGLPMRLR